MTNYNSEFMIGSKKVGINHPTYFIADVGANHDGKLDKALQLIHMCKESGADAVKFQHFKAETIVSDYGFKNLQTKQSHQAKWKKSVFEVYNDASLNQDWTARLKEESDKIGIDFFTSPYSLDLVDYVDPYVAAYKIGSGDITWPKVIEKMALKGKPMLLASGASNLGDVQTAMDVLSKKTKDIVLMQCNTNYTADIENFKYINLNVLKTFSNMYPGVVLGLSDHTLGHTTVLGAVTLGARVIEKHFTDNNGLEGPDHHFAMNPTTWRDMVNATRELEYALGDGNKKVEQNEQDTVVIQRRAIRAKVDLKSGETLSQDKIECLRPCPPDSITPVQFDLVVGSKLVYDIAKGDIIRWKDLS